MSDQHPWFENEIRRVFTYQEATSKIPVLKPLVRDLKYRFIRVRMIERRIENTTVSYKSIQLADDHERAVKKAQEVCFRILELGVTIHEMLHGLVIFPFLHPKEKEIGGFLYRDATDSIETWVNLDQANFDTEGDWHVSRLCTGIVNPIPDEWLDW